MSIVCMPPTRTHTRMHLCSCLIVTIYLSGSASGRVKTNTPPWTSGIDAAVCTRILPDRIALRGGRSPTRT